MRHSEDLGFRVWPFLVWDSVVNTLLLWQWHVSVQHISWQTTLKKTCQSSLLQQCKCIFENESWYFHAYWGCWHWLQQWQILASVYIFDKRGCCLSSSDTDHDTFRDLMHTGSSQHVPMKGYLIQTSDVLGAISKITFSIHVSEWILFLFIPQNYIFNSNSNSNGIPMQCALL